MSPKQFISILLRNLKWLILVPAVLGASIFYFTRGEKKAYSSETTIYTGIASGYTLNGNNKVDFYSTNNAFDNLLSIINSRETKDEVAVQLLSTHLQLQKHDPAVLSWESWKELRKLVPDSMRNVLVKASLSATIATVDSFMHASENNLVYKIINSDIPYYSLSALQSIKALRINTSDLIKISYETNDAAICKSTLVLLNDIFVRKQHGIRENQTESVVNYFEKETQRAFRKLDSSENLFLQFNVNNDIINYYEQTKSIAGEKENLYALNNSLEMDQKAQSFGLDKVNENIKGRAYQSLYGSEIIEQKGKLSEVYNRIAYKEMLGNKNPGDKRETDSLKAVASLLEINMKSSVNKLYVQTNTPNGIPTKEMMDEWVKSTLAFEQSKARLTVMDKRKKEFDVEYQKMAPLGATLKKIERQISVSEQEYLELLHGLSMARLAQQNNELTSKLSIIDAPYLPLKANASKRMFQVIIGGMAGFVVVLALLLARFFANKTIQQPVRAGKQVGLQIMGLYPLLNESKAFIEEANMRLLQQFFSKVDFKNKPVIIGVCSIQKDEGKTTVVNTLRKDLVQLQYRVEHCSWNGGGDITYDHSTDIVFVEFSQLNRLVLAPGRTPKLDYALLVCRANRTWSRIDKGLLDIFTKITRLAPLLVLNGVDSDYAQEYIGQIVKKKSAIRSFFIPGSKITAQKKYA